MKHVEFDAIINGCTETTIHFLIKVSHTIYNEFFFLIYIKKMHRDIY